MDKQIIYQVESVLFVQLKFTGDVEPKDKIIWPMDGWMDGWNNDLLFDSQFSCHFFLFRFTYTLWRPEDTGGAASLLDVAHVDMQSKNLLKRGTG